VDEETKEGKKKKRQGTEWSQFLLVRLSLKDRE
jgi:hypothetical protein